MPAVNLAGRCSLEDPGLPRLKTIFSLTALILLALPLRALALNRFCDVAFEDCRTPLIQLIDNETDRIDVAFWFMEDARFSAALARAVARGVKVRVIFDSEELNGQSDRQFVIDQLIGAGIPIRDKVDDGIAHWKVMIFSAQHTVEFSGGNYTAEAFVPDTPYSAYEDEVIYFTEDPSLLASFKTKYDDVWTSNTGMLANYANVTTIERVYPITPIDPRLNFVPFDSFRDRSVATYRAETQRIDAIIYRITDRAHTDALIENVERGIPLRLITEPLQYRDETRLWHSWNVDRLWWAGQQNKIAGQPGIQIRHRLHAGLTHEKLSLMIGQGMTVFGSSNWTSPSTETQLEHNIFTTDPTFFAWAHDAFERKWNNLGPAPETQPFTPLPPDTPALASPADGATNQPVSVALQWHGGPWAHKYDVFVGTGPGNMVQVLNKDDNELGPYDQGVTVSGLLPGTRYYWYVVSWTMAYMSETSATQSFVTAGTAGINTPPSISITSPSNGASVSAPGTVMLTVNASDVDGSVTRVDYFANSNPIPGSPMAPFTMTWNNVPAGTYTVTARATDNLGATTTSAPVTITVGGGLPGGWAQQDIGGPAQAGNASISGNAWTVSGSGADVWGTSDQFHFVYQMLTGDGSVIARVAAVQPVDVWTKAGVMIRESLTAGSRHAFMFSTPGTTNGLAFQRRLVTNDVTTHDGAPGAPPVWVKLTRSGNVFSAYRSVDGVTWTLVASDTIAMASTVFAGLAVTAHNNSAIGSATFDGVSVIPAGGPPANVPPSVSLTSPGAGATFTAPANITLTASASDSDGTVSQVDFYVGGTLIQTDTSSPYSITWSNVPVGNYTFTARATDNGGAVTVSAPISIQVVAGPPGLPAPWTQQDIGSPGQAGDASGSGSTWTVSGGGADVWGTSDQFHFVYQTLTGDGSVIAHVATVQPVDVWTKAGVMIRQSESPGSPQAFMFSTPGTTKGIAFQRRVTQDGISTHDGIAGAPPTWVKLARAGDVFSAYQSNDGVTWTLVATQTIPMGSTVLAGLAVCAHNNSALATATFDNVFVTPGVPSSGLPAGWSNQDIGTVAAAGSTTYSGGVFTVRGSGTDIWGTADQFQFAYRSMTGNGTIVAHVQSVEFVDRWTKAGVMIRASLAAGSRHAMMIVSPGKGFAFQRRTDDNSDSVSTAGPLATAPAWVKLERNGTLITASISMDGANWTMVGTQTIDLPATVLVGLPLTSHLNGAVATATIDTVTVIP
jgi:regulation of enolase protein 1 (concanavalin A-like superfamily)/phosphatidylserine/phosphatidylglycerophosphate/cardiolipin synthase-like enzyme